MPTKHNSSSHSSSDDDHEAKKTPLDGSAIFSNLTIFIIQTKIDSSELDLLYQLAESNGANIQSSIEHADVVVTRISMQMRLERHLSCDMAKRKAIVTPAWLTQSVSKGERLAFSEYAAIRSLEEYTESRSPDHSCEAPLSGAVLPASSSSRSISHTSRFAVQRLSPLVCPNQDLVAQLNVIRDARVLEGDGRSAMSYSRTIAAIKAYPRQINSAEQVAHLPFVGPKILSMIRQYISSGHVAESLHTSNSTRYRCLAAFACIHGIGPSTARALYSDGCRTYEDLDRRFGAEYGQGISAMESGDAGIRTMLELRDDLSTTLPRDEVEEISRVVAKELEAVEPGCKYMICGGYRRGKLQCNDVDFVFTHPQSGKDRDLCKKLVARLHHRGLVTHVLHLSSFRSSNPSHTSAGASGPDRPHWDILDKSLTIFRLPEANGSMTRRLHRRVDLICAPIETYWTAVVGWGLKFDSSGITRRRDTKPLFPMSEHAVFELLGLEWIDPSMRNADL